jgi:hypothetical protein
MFTVDRARQKMGVPIRSQSSAPVAAEPDFEFAPASGYCRLAA